jgi:hypothetical protein
MNFLLSAILGVIAYFLFPLDGFSFTFSDMATVNLLCFLGCSRSEVVPKYWTMW